MKALVVYTGASGQKDFTKRIPFVQKELAGVFTELDFVHSQGPLDLQKIAIKSAAEYDCLLIAGGDGTFNKVVNALAPLDKTPVLGYLNFGTIGDVGRNFGIGKSLKQGLDVIKNGHIRPFDVGQINNFYFAYVATIGCYSEIAYKTQRNKKKRWGRWSYYHLALKDMSHKTDYLVRYTIDGLTKEARVPFLMVLNGQHMGGLKVNKRGTIDDGKMELYLPKTGATNGLASSLFMPNKVVIEVTSVTIDPQIEMPWCLDGEVGPVGPATITLLPHKLTIFSKQ